MRVGADVARRARGRQSARGASRSRLWPPTYGQTLRRFTVSAADARRFSHGRQPAASRRAPRALEVVYSDTTLRVIGHNGELITTVPRNSRAEITRFNAYGTRQPG